MEPSAVDEPTTAVNLNLSDVPFAPFDPNKPAGIHVYPIEGDPSDGAFNAIVRLPARYRSPLHSHTAGFSGVTMSEGLVHGATADAADPLPKGSNWYQPAGEPHVDACVSETPCYLLAFFEGAVDMIPADAPAEAPVMKVNRGDQLEWTEVKGGVKMFAVHGNHKEGPFKALFQFPAGMATNVHTHTAAFTGALLSGNHQRGTGPDQLVQLTEGAVWNQPAGTPHMEKCGEEANCIFAASMDGPLDTNAVELSPKAE